MPSWVIKYLLPVGVFVALVIGVNWWFNNQISTATKAGHDAGVAEAKETCRTVTVPAAQKLVQDQCDENAKITEASNAKQLTDAKTAADRATRQLNQLLARNAGSVCVPIADNSSVAGGGTGAVRPAGASGLDARDLIRLGQQCRARSDDFIRARQFILDTWAKRDPAR